MLCVTKHLGQFRGKTRTAIHCLCRRSILQCLGTSLQWLPAKYSTTQYCNVERHFQASREHMSNASWFSEIDDVWETFQSTETSKFTIQPQQVVIRRTRHGKWLAHLFHQPLSTVSLLPNWRKTIQETPSLPQLRVLAQFNYPATIGKQLIFRELHKFPLPTKIK